MIRFLTSFKGFKWWNWVIYSISSFIILFIALIPIIYSLSWLFYFLYFLLFLGFAIYGLLTNSRFLRDSSGNGIVYGGRGKGKGLLLQKKANSQIEYFSNVPMGGKRYDFNLKEYSQSIGANTIINAIEGTIIKVKKLHKFEGINILFDDTTVYAPNFEDTLLKRLYPSLPLTLAVNRHLYGHYMLITVQDRERPYKIIKELQTDFSIKAIDSRGWGFFWKSIPILRSFYSVKYRFYEEVKASQEGVLPFGAKGLLNEGLKHGYLTSGQATKESFEAQYGRVYNGRVWGRKSMLSYDTRYFHDVFFGYPASKIKENENN